MCVGVGACVRVWLCVCVGLGWMCLVFELFS